MADGLTEEQKSEVRAIIAELYVHGDLPPAGDPEELAVKLGDLQQGASELWHAVAQLSDDLSDAGIEPSDQFDQHLERAERLIRLAM